MRKAQTAQILHFLTKFLQAAGEGIPTRATASLVALAVARAAIGVLVVVESVAKVFGAVMVSHRIVLNQQVAVAARLKSAQTVLLLKAGAAATVSLLR